MELLNEMRSASLAAMAASYNTFAKMVREIFFERNIHVKGCCVIISIDKINECPCYINQQKVKIITRVN